MQTRRSASPVSFGDDGMIVPFGRVPRLQHPKVQSHALHDDGAKAPCDTEAQPLIGADSRLAARGISPAFKAAPQRWRESAVQEAIALGITTKAEL